MDRIQQTVNSKQTVNEQTRQQSLKTEKIKWKKIKCTHTRASLFDTMTQNVHT